MWGQNGNPPFFLETHLFILEIHLFLRETHLFDGNPQADVSIFPTLSIWQHYNKQFQNEVPTIKTIS